MRHAALPALLIGLVALATIATVWTLEARGYVPCELCLKERVPFYVGAPLALALAALGRRAGRIPLAAGYALLAVLFIAGVGLGLYHAGVEWKLWPGPSECSGTAAAPAAVADFLQQLKTVNVVRCDAPAMVVLGLSLAGWNAILSLALAGAALVGMNRARDDLRPGPLRG